MAQREDVGFIVLDEWEQPSSDKGLMYQYSFVQKMGPGWTNWFGLIRAGLVIPNKWS
jgi:hypothetical protein